MEKTALMELIKSTFSNVRLEDGVGLWEAQGLDDYADDATLKELRAKDEREDWSAISYEDLSCCCSSLSFFDAKGMLFNLPQFLIYDLEYPDALDTDLMFTLTHKFDWEYQRERFSLFTGRYAYVIVCYFEYHKQLIVDKCNTYSQDYGVILSPEEYNPEEIKMDEYLKLWKSKV